MTVARSEDGRAMGERPYCVYVVRCRDGTLYTGTSNDVAARVARHNAGRGARYTRGRRPVELVYCETVGDKGPALAREWAVKQLSRAEKLALLRPVRRRRRALGIP